MGNKTPLSFKIELLKIAEIYCNIEFTPNIGWRDAAPEIILNSFKIFVKGKWYHPASGLYTVSNDMKIVTKIETKKLILSIEKIFLFLICSIKKKKIGIKKKLFMFWESGEKKLSITAIIPIGKKPYMPYSNKFIFLFLKKNLLRK